MVMPSEGIVPGTLPYGEREGFAAAADAAGQDAPSTPAATSGAAGVGGPLDPLQSMLTGNIPPSADPVTAGLSVGPGASPSTSPGASDPIKQRLQYVALNAKSPKLRLQARSALRAFTMRRALPIGKEC